MITYGIESDDYPNDTFIKISEVVKRKHGKIDEVFMDDGFICMNVDSIYWNKETGKIEENLESEFEIYKASIVQGIYPLSVSHNLVELLEQKISETKENMDKYNNLVLNSSLDEDVQEMEGKYQHYSSVLNDIYKLIKQSRG